MHTDDQPSSSSEQVSSPPAHTDWRAWLEPLEAARKSLQQPHHLSLASHIHQFQTELAELASASTDKTAFCDGTRALASGFLKQSRKMLEADLRQRRDGAFYVGMYALIIDTIIGGFSHHLNQNFFKNLSPIAIMATGGYGRGELAPFSDIDLLFVPSAALPESATQETEFIESILSLLWDMGLKVGHATRSVRENLHAARQDVTICTSLIELRIIGGSESLGEQLKNSFKRWTMRQAVPPFVQAKLEERDSRIAFHGGTRYAVEPNVKDGKGGLRDLHTLFWITKFSYRLDKITDLLQTRPESGNSQANIPAQDHLRQEELRNFAVTQRFLWTVRCFVHLHHNRADDRLTFDAQTEIAPALGFTNRSGLRDVERFMKYYFMSAIQVGNLTRIFCAAIGSDFTEKTFSLRSFLRSTLPIGLDIAPFELKDGRLHLPQGRLFRNNFSLIVRIFYLAQMNNLDIHPDSVKRLTRAVRAAKTADLQSPRAFETFVNILTAPSSPERILRLMNESQWLGKFLPDFGRIVGMMQFDMYHSYTVDEHTIKAVGFIHALEHGQLKEDAPLASGLINTIESRRALHVAMLLHDIAKGRGGDHSVLGAEVASQICPEMGLSDEETETIIWLIRHHLLMSKTAFRYDLNDPQTIEDFASYVQSPERLKLLLCLTVADIQAVGPSVWNGWKASLMRDLYHRALAVLGGTAPNEVSHYAVAEQIAQVKEALSDWNEEEADAHISQFYPSYWTNFSLSSHLYHAELIRHYNQAQQKIQINFKDDEDSKSTILVVIASDHPGLFSRIVGAVAISGCSIMTARINTRQDGTILDQFRIQRNRQAVTDPHIKQRISQLIEQSFAGEVSLYTQLQQKMAQRSKRVKVMDVPPRIIVTNKRSRSHTVIEVNGPDRPGLLYQITYHLAQLNLQINSATVSTYGEKAVDVFYVKDVFGLQITKQSTQDKIASTLKEIFAP